MILMWKVIITTNDKNKIKKNSCAAYLWEIVIHLNVSMIIWFFLKNIADIYDQFNESKC